MIRISNELRLHYHILLFVSIFPLAASRPVSVILDGVGRNSVWFLLPVLLLALAGTWMSLQISKRCGGISLMLACGEITFRWLTPVTYVLYAMLYLSIAAYTIALAGDFSSRVIQYGDSRTAIIFGVLIATLAALFPIETMIRYSQVLMIIVVPISMALSSVMLIDAQWSWIQPMFNVKEIVHPSTAAAAVMSIFSPLAAVTLISRKNTRISFLSLSAYITLVALFLSYLIAMTITTFGIHSAQQMEFAVFYGQSAAHIQNSIFERVIFLSSILFSYFKIIGNAFLMRCAALSLAQAFGIQLGIFPVLLTGGIIAATFWKMNIPFFFLKAPLWLGYYSFSLIVIFPALIYGILMLRGGEI